MKLPYLGALFILTSIAFSPLSTHAALLTSDLSLGSRGTEVTQVQLILFQFGYSTAAPNGVYDEGTATGVRALQKKYGLAETGTMNSEVRAILNPFIARNPTSRSTAPVISGVSSVPSSVNTRTGSALTVGARGAAVLELQQKLATLGYFTETPTGYFGPLTRAAVVKLQAARGLEQVGYVGPKTRETLTTVSTTQTISSSSVSTSSAGSTAIHTTSGSEKAPTLSFRADKRSVPVGDVITLTWNARYADTCTAENGWSGVKSTAGSENFTISAITTFALVCSGPGGTVSKSVTISLADQPLDPTIQPKTPTLEFVADRTTVTTGENVKLTWNSTYASSCSATGAWSGTRALDGTETLLNLTASGTYTLACVGDGGSITRSLTITVNQVVTPPPEPPPVSGGSYSVYPGCEAPASSYARVLYVDPRSGTTTGDGSAALPFNTLQSGFDRKLINPGDRVVLLPGTHGKVLVDAKYKHAYLAGSTGWIWIDAQDGALITSIETRSLDRVLITNGEFKGAAGTYMVQTSGGNNIVVAGNKLYTTTSTSGWGAADWISGTAHGIGTRNTRCVSITNNNLKNVRFGIGIASDGLPDTDPTVNGLVENNTILGFSGDGIRPNASNVTVRGNRIIESMAGSADGDLNHDDGIQVFAPRDGIVYKNIVLENNWIQETTNSSRPLIGTLQGIGQFDGPVSDEIVRNNVVIVSAYWGIALYGPKNTVIERNTIINSGASTNRVRIGINNVVDGGITYVPENVTVRDNITTLVLKSTTSVNLTDINNYLVPDQTGYPNLFVKYDAIGGAFDLHAKSGGPIDGMGVGASGLTSGLGSQATSRDRYAQTAGAGATHEQLENLYHQLRTMLERIWKK